MEDAASGDRTPVLMEHITAGVPRKMTVKYHDDDGEEPHSKSASQRRLPVRLTTVMPFSHPQDNDEGDERSQTGVAERVKRVEAMTRT